MVCMGKHTFANCYRMQVFSFHGVIEYSELGGTHTRITESHSYFYVCFFQCSTLWITCISKEINLHVASWKALLYDPRWCLFQLIKVNNKNCLIHFPKRVWVFCFVSPVCLWSGVNKRALCPFKCGKIACSPRVFKFACLICFWITLS